jgi:hypothetical protein
MNRNLIRVWAVRLTLVVATAAIPATQGLAQIGQDDARQGAASFAGGRMVRGTITAVAPDKLTVKTEEGDTYQVVLSANTRLTKDRQPVKTTDIKVGDGIGAMGELDQSTKTVHALFVGVVDAEQVKKARENMGKTYITGKVTAIDLDGLKVTVERPDGVSQVIGVDEQTSFKRGGRGVVMMASGAGMMDMGSGQNRGAAAGASAPTAGSSANTGGESITFADVKVGDMIAGQGGLKNGVFVPTELRVINPAGMGQRRRRPDGGAAGAGTPGTTPAAATTPATPPATPK